MYLIGVMSLMNFIVGNDCMYLIMSNVCNIWIVQKIPNIYDDEEYLYCI
jgi:predicted DNA-binding protein (UPF0278 family)